MNGSLPPFKPLGWRGPDIKVESRADGCFLIASKHPAGTVPPSIGHILAARAARHPDRPFLRERQGPVGAWRSVSYGEALDAAEAVAQALTDRRLNGKSAVLILSGNSIEHALLTLGCLTAGVPVVPISPSFSLIPNDRTRLLHCARRVAPDLVFAQSSAQFEDAIAALRDRHPDIEVVSVDGGPGTSFASLLKVAPTASVTARRDAIAPDDVAKILFTSGSTGLPKAVPQTHKMLTTVLAGLDGLRTEAADSDVIPESLEWMPWSHIAAGNINFNSVLHNGGTLYLDEGRPLPGMFDATIRNLREVSPISFASAPIAFGMLADALERDAELRKNFFRNLRYMAYGGATLSNDIYERLQAMAIAETGYRIPLTTMYGSTETQGITMTHWATERVGLIGLPMPGITLKLVPNGPKLEVRVKGPSVMPGYLGDPARNDDAFDQEGFYRLGDAVRFVDPADPRQGLVFDGRVTEDFKLDSGTWVSVGTLRPALVAACSPCVQDAVIAGQDKRYLAALLWPSAAALQAFSADGELDVDALAAELSGRLASHNATAGGASRRIERFSIMTVPLNSAAGEINDKGYVNQSATLDSRTEKVTDLYRNPPPPTVYLASPVTGGRGHAQAL
ncbi:AMP-binding protein [Bradyrhizobium sp. INPA03-11B]|uniref:AMP-binding protein n=1 Tax=Bradyrhizobium sp. INPA03-11B TaxID=418598 RepID=UPI00338F6592